MTSLQSIIKTHPENFFRCIGAWVPDEWEPTVCDAVVRMIAAMPRVEILQIKEKFNTLRIYVDFGNREVFRIIEEAEQAISELEAGDDAQQT